MADVVQTTAVTGENFKVISWTPLTSADAAGVAQEVGNYNDLCFQVTGTFGTGTCVLQGSNDGTNWFTLNDAQGSAISKTAAALEQVVEAPRYIRPAVTGADGTTSLTVLVCARQARGII